MKTLPNNVSLPARCKFCDSVAVAMLSVLMICSPITSYAAVIKTDPLLVGATVEQTILLEKQYKKRNKLREATLIAQGTIAAGLEEIHRLEYKVLDYMGNASGVLTNLIQFKNIAEYGVTISSQLVKLAKSIPDNPKGAAITAVCNKQITSTTADVAAMTELVTTLVSTKYSLKDAKSEDDKRHVNLLSSAERYNILVSVEQKLSKISFDLMLLQYFVETLSWNDLWKGLDRESYLKAITLRVDINDIINKWNKVTK